MAGKIILVTGGARSGKSTFAENLVTKYGHKIAYIATAQIFDDEMRLRVKLHRQRRPANWTTYEAPFEAEEIITQAAAEHDTILFDCLTVYTSNYICRDDLPVSAEDRFIGFKAYIQKLIEAAVKAVNNTDRLIVFVTNETGLGIVPDNPLGREYRDWSGILNQMFAAVSEQVYLVVCGIPVDVKKLAATLEE